MVTQITTVTKVHHIIKWVDIQDNYNSILFVIITWYLFVVVNMLIDI